MPALFFPVARKEYMKRRHAAFGAIDDQNSSPQPMRLISPSIPWSV
jgi:hypothetical protein